MTTLQGEREYRVATAPQAFGSGLPNATFTVPVTDPGSVAQDLGIGLSDAGAHFTFRSDVDALIAFGPDPVALNAGGSSRIIYANRDYRWRCTPGASRFFCVAKLAAEGPDGTLRYYCSQPSNPQLVGWFVDSVAGNDANDGRTIGTPFQSLTRLIAAGPAGTDTIYLKRGSTWLEELTGLATGATVREYGGGAALPIIDGRDAALNANFVAVGGATPNVYSIAWSHDFGPDGGKCKHRAWENSAMLTRVGSVADCNATAGSFYAADPTNGGPDTIYIHPVGSTNPITDGNLYQFSARRWCVQLYTAYHQASVYNVSTIGNAHADGSLVVDGYAEGCTPRDGRVHNCFIRGKAKNIVATGIDQTEDYAIFISYMDVGSPGATGRNVVFENCTADAGMISGIGSGFYVHTDAVRQWGTAQYNGCNVIGCQSGYGGIQAATFVYYDCAYTDVLNAFIAVGNTNTVVLGGAGVTQDAVNNKLLSYSTTAVFNLIARGLKLYRMGNGEGPIVIDAANAIVSLARCTLVGKAAGGQMFNKLKSGRFTWELNVLDGPNMSTITIATAAAQLAAFAADSNVYHPSAGGIGIAKEFGGHVDYIDLPSWRAYLAGVALGPEASTVTTDPQLVNPAGGDFTVQNAAVIALGAGAAQDEAGDPVLQALWTTYQVTQW